VLGYSANSAASLLAYERLDTWVLKISIAIPLVSVVFLVLVHLARRVFEKFARKRKAIRQSPEPPSRSQSPERAASEALLAVRSLDVGQGTDNPEQLQQACAACEDSLAAMYLQLAEIWSRRGQIDQAERCWQKIVRSFPETRHVDIAQSRLQQVRAPSVTETFFEKPGASAP
jgi:hypothetical protein